MEKSITITPADKEMRLLLEAARLKNDFMLLGFDSRRSFVEIMLEHKPAYNNQDGINTLFLFWQVRAKNAELLSDVGAVLNVLKGE